MVRDEEDGELEDATRNANMLQTKQLITNNVTNKRKEQLQRWQSSEMNGEPLLRRKKPRVQFQDSDIFLSACMSGDEDEVDELLNKGADINTATVDGLTALHQSVIDSKPDMVRFLCEKGADVNAQDNEGWTPLHAAACCGNVAIVKYLCQHGADLSIINSDKELALDLADDEACREYLEADYYKQGINPEQCRDQELTTMMRDVQKWLHDGEYKDRPHVRTGATAMHVAAAKGYTQLLEMLIKAGGNVRGHDRDGWTPLHAAAHWAERDSCKILLEHGASTLDQNYAGQNVLSVADKEIIEYLEDLERAAEKRRSPSISALANVLQEKNTRISHEEHTLSTEYKRELQHKDQTSENDVLHSISKARLFDKSSSMDSQSSQDSQQPNDGDGQLVNKDYETDPETAYSARSSEERSLTDRSSILTDRTSASYDRSESSEKSMSVDSQRSSSVISSSSSVTTSQNTSDGSSCSVQSGDQHVSCTVPMPRPLQQPNSWINRGVHLITRSNSSSVSSRPSGPDSVSQSSHSSGSLQSATSSNSILQTPSVLTPTLTKPPPWQSNAVNESEAERRNTARMQRQHRRSTQGVTKEQLEEASRLAAEDSVRRRGSDVHNITSKTVCTVSNAQREPAVVRLASEERDSTSMTVSESSSSSSDRVGAISRTANAVLRESSERTDRSISERLSESRTSPPTTSVTLSLPNVPSPGHTPSAAGLRRKSQGMSLSRSNRRGTGPVLAEDVHAAVSARSLASDPVPPALRYAPGSTVSATYSRPLNTSANRTDIVRGSASTTQIERSLEKSHSAPPSQPPPAAPSAAAGLRSVAVAPSAVGRVQSRVAGHPTVSTVTTYPNSQPVNSRPSETNLNYKALYEKEKLESERLRKEMEELKRTHDNNSVSSFRAVSSRFRNGSPAGSLPISKSASGISLDENERRSMERKISDLEIQLKGLNQLRMENQRLKEENGALVRVISKMTI